MNDPNIQGSSMQAQEDASDADVAAAVGSAHHNVVDAISVRKRLKGAARSVGGIGALINRVRADKGKGGVAYSPEVQHQSTSKDNFDAVLREAIEEAVHELAKRFDASVADSR